MFCPDKTRCARCGEDVDVTYLCIHFLLCQKKKEGIKNSLKVIQEENLETFQSVCRYCKRKFLPERLEIHQQACEWASKKRPVFDISKKRQAFPNESRSKNSPKRSPNVLKYPNSKWQKQHVQLLQSLRESKSISAYLEYVKCQHCSRKFAPNIAENHIEICKNILNKPKPPSYLNKQVKNVISPKIDIKKKTASHKVLARPSSVLKKTRETSELGFMSTSIEEGKTISNLSPDLSSMPALKKPSRRKKIQTHLKDPQASLKPTKLGKSQSERKHSTRALDTSPDQDFLYKKQFECTSCGFQSESCKFCLNCGSLSIIKQNAS